MKTPNSKHPIAEAILQQSADLQRDAEDGVSITQLCEELEADENTLAAPRQTDQTCSPRATAAESAGFGTESHQTGKMVAKTKGVR